MSKTIHLGTFGGIPLKLHWTFGLLVIYLTATAIGQGSTLYEGLWFGGYVLALFICVVLHEYGHAFAAKKYGVTTKDIILSPIGGVARLEKIPEKPKHELIIALAGPAVNVVLAILLGIIIFFTFDLSNFNPELDLLGIHGPTEFTLYLFALNIILVVFNMIPAFPMDGGRVLRSLLAMKFGRVKATNIASYIGKFLAIIFIIYGLHSSNYVLALIGGFIFLTATAENRITTMTSRLKNLKLRNIIKTQFTRLHIGDKMQKPIELYTRDIESNFLVFDSLGYIAGSLPELFIKNAIEEGLHDEMVGNYISKKTTTIDVDTSLMKVYETMNEKGIAIIAVKENDELIGVIDRRAISRIIAG